MAPAFAATCAVLARQSGQGRRAKAAASPALERRRGTRCPAAGRQTWGWPPRRHATCACRGELRATSGPEPSCGGARCFSGPTATPRHAPLLKHLAVGRNERGGLHLRHSNAGRQAQANASGGDALGLGSAAVKRGRRTRAAVARAQARDTHDGIAQRIRRLRGLRHAGSRVPEAGRCRRNAKWCAQTPRAWPRQKVGALPPTGAGRGRVCAECVLG